jgi:DNA (cytosine-5)-methyltransferase 1
MKKIRLLDLCCGAGGCAMGYKLAADDLGLEIEIVGIDTKEQKNYPFKFIQDDALSFLIKWGRGFTHIHASPPCQEYTHNSNARTKAKKEGSVSILPEVKAVMYQSKLPGVIENVMGSPLVKDIILDGRMFGLKVIRRRIFETVNWFSMKPGVPQYQKGMVMRGECMVVAGHGSNKNRWGTDWQIEGKSVIEKRSKAMGIDWMNDREIAQAIPPAYTRYIGNDFLKA